VSTPQVSVWVTRAKRRRSRLASANLACGDSLQVEAWDHAAALGSLLPEIKGAVRGGRGSRRSTRSLRRRPRARSVWAPARPGQRAGWPAPAPKRPPGQVVTPAALRNLWAKTQQDRGKGTEHHACRARARARRTSWRRLRCWTPLDASQAPVRTSSRSSVCHRSADRGRACKK